MGAAFVGVHAGSDEFSTVHPPVPVCPSLAQVLDALPT